MRIKRLDIREGMFVKTFTFDDGMTLICSNGKNSVGKTTLIRLLLFALGENVFMTQGFDPEKLVTRVIILTDVGKLLTLTRDGDTLTIEGNDEPERLIPSLQSREIKKAIYGIDNGELADNLLGAHYIDQDKGWTLLNRGKVIGGIQFNIEGFLRGLSGDDYARQHARLQQIESDIKKYQFFVQAAGYQDSLVDVPSARELAPDKSRDRERLNQLRIQSASLKKKIATIRRAQNSNERFVNYVIDMGLRVKTEDGVVEITPDNLLYYQDNERYLNGEVLALSTEKAEVDRKIQELEGRLDDEEGLFHVDRVDTTEFDRQIAGMKLDLPAYEALLTSLKNERAELKKKMKERFSLGNALFDALTETVNSLCDELGVGDYFRGDNGGVLTKTLKRKSGTKYHLLVFAYRLAYAATVYQRCNLRLPIIIDSIRGREMSQENLDMCLVLLADKFSDYQIIVASISADGIAPDKIIPLQGRVMEDAAMVPNLDEWEPGE